MWQLEHLYVFFFFFFFYNSGIRAVTFPTIPSKMSSTPTEGMLNPLWPRLEPGWRAVQLYLLYHQATSAWYLVTSFFLVILRNESLYRQYSNKFFHVFSIKNLHKILIFADQCTNRRVNLTLRVQSQ